MRSTRHSSLVEAAMILALGAGHGAGVVARTPGRVTNADPNPHRPRPPKRNTELQREIAAHNEAVEARKAAKKARKAKTGGAA